MLTLVYTLSFLDRGLLGLLLEPIKVELALTDSELGLLTGMAFGLFYAVLGLPLARLADRGNRVTLAAVAIALWGATMMSCLFVATYAQLLLTRVFAAVGEAGAMPPTYSLLGDYFEEARARVRAMAVYFMAGPLAWLISFGVGGWINEAYGWRIAFFVMGLPALAAALLVKFTLVEPRRQAAAAAPGIEAIPSLRAVAVSMWANLAMRHLGLALVIFYTMLLGLLPWYASFLIRSHAMTTGELGVWLGLILGIGGAVGVVCGGNIIGHFLGGDAPRQMRLAAWLTVGLIPALALFLFSPTGPTALVALVPYTLMLSAFSGPVFALLQEFVAPRSRATSMALVMMIANLVGMSIGPQFVGVLSDQLAPRFGADSLRYAMFAFSFIALWAGAHFAIAARAAAAGGDAVGLVEPALALEERGCR